MAIGGGVCLDVTGLAANLYRRNTPVIKASTHLTSVILLKSGETFSSTACDIWQFKQLPA